ncbi:MAG: sugar transferase [Candidatus Omnitrophica bacterium]|nr:sugar transferase [Candidatus Omnitrophota bacterium]
MINYKRNVIKLSYKLIDLTLICLAIYIACLLRPGTLGFKVTPLSIFFLPDNPFRAIFIFWIVTTLLLLNTKQLYQTRREILEGYELNLVIRQVFLSGLIVIGPIYVLKLHDFPRSVLILGTVFNMVLLCTWRVLKRILVGYLVSKGYNNFNTLIIGAGKVGVALEREISRIPQMGIKVKGFLDDYKIGQVNGKKGLEVLGKLADFKTIAKKEFINKVFITIHSDYQAFNRLLIEARELNIAIRVIPQGFELISSEYEKYNIGIIPIIEYSNEVPLRVQLGKRLFDFIISITGTIILLPFFLGLSLAVRLDSPGPVFYVSRRYGRMGKVFGMYKFRSMYLGADKMQDNMTGKNEADGPIFKIRQDPRITKTGRFLRKYSLDELPQIINVLKGDMSLVGPRPLPIEQIEKEDLRQLERLEVRPGITGLWQIRGRSDLSFRRLLRWDLWYINNWSFWLDLNILLRTLPVVIKGKGAY